MTPSGVMKRGQAGGQAEVVDMMNASMKSTQSRFMNGDRSFVGNFPSLDKIKMNSKQAFVRRVSNDGHSTMYNAPEARIVS